MGEFGKARAFWRIACKGGGWTVQEMTCLIVHVDADAFFASVEQLLIPALRARPVIVGSGCIASCSYEARRMGLHAGMSLVRAGRLCPQAVLCKGDYQIYRCFAERIWEICRQYTCGLETYLDEAYGDAGGMERVHGPPLTLGRKLQQQVLDEVGLPVSVGLAGNRMMAKIASASAKPGGVAYVQPGQEEDFLADLPIGKLPGVGHKTARKLADMNIRTAGQLRALSRDVLGSMLGRRGQTLYERCRGRDPQVLRPVAMPSTISRETTFHKPTCDRNEIRAMLFYLLERAMRAVRQASLTVGRVELSIRHDDWKQLATRRTLPQPTSAEYEAFRVVEEMLAQMFRRRVALRHVGIVLSGFSRAAGGAVLFEPRQEASRRRLCVALDAIRNRYGHAAVVAGESISLMGRLERNDYGFVLRTPSLTK